MVGTILIFPLPLLLYALSVTIAFIHDITVAHIVVVYVIVSLFPPTPLSPPNKLP